MNDEVRRGPVAWEPWAACGCFIAAVISLVIGVVLTTRWLLDEQVHPLLHGIGLVLLIIGIPLIILGGHFMDLSEKKSTRVKLLLVLFVLWLAPNHVNAQDQTSEEQPEPPHWEYGGFLDAAYPLDFNHPANHLFRSRGTAFHTDSVWLNMAGAYVRKKPTEASRWGVELTAHAGKDDELFGFSATAPNIAGFKFLRHLGPTNVSYLAPVGKGLTVQAGIFSSLIGYDSLYAKDNLNYTRPWGADFTPYLMMGANVSYPFTEKLTGTFFVVNGYWHLARANSAPSAGGQIAYKLTPRVTLKETALVGPHQRNTASEFWRFLTDTIVERKTQKFTLASEYIFSTERVDAVGRPRALMMSWQAPARWTLNDRWSLSFRPEVFWDRDGRWTLAKQTVKVFTTTLEYRRPYKWSNAIFRLEHRFDDSRGPEGGFFRGAETPASLTPQQHLLIFATIFTFDSQEK